VATHPDRLALFIAFNEEVAHLVYGSSDMFLMPSRFEPCGLGQLIALRYGSIPVVRRTGGLADTVEDVDINLERGNGFVFQSYDSASLIKAVKRAEEAFYDRAAWQKLMKRNMALDLSWEISARKYEDVYNQAVRLSHSAPSDN
jgi:starch synthase